MALAGRYRSAVEILAERTESSQTFAQPDGSFRTVQMASPQRVRRGTGWVPVDPTLKLTDGVVSPGATTLPVRFSGGGSAPMVSIGTGEKTVTLKWQTDLPVPTLTGDTATYAEVFPGVDLKLTAGVSSFSQVLVVKNAEAAKNPSLTRLQFGLATSGVTMQQDADGFLRAVDASGAAVFVSDGAKMWDSPEPVQRKAAVQGRSQARAVDEPVVESAPSRTEDVPVQLSPQALTLAPSTAMLTDPDTNFPVYIDPGYKNLKEIWTMVSRKHPGTSYWSGSDYRDFMRVGQNWQSSADDDWRTLIKFDVSQLKSTQLIKASVHVIVGHTANCVKSPIQLWRTQAISKSNAVTWNSTKGKSWKRLAEVNATANDHVCPKGDDEIGFGQKAVKTALQDAATRKYPSITLAFKAKSEADDYQWKKLQPNSAYLDIFFNHKPGKPTGLAFEPCYKACKSPASTSTNRPKLTMAVKDADAGKLTYQYEVWKADGSRPAVATSKLTESGIASGRAHGWTVPKSKALKDGTYRWRGRARDSYAWGPWSSAGDSVMFTFTVDTTNPLVPDVDSKQYPQPSAWSGGPGTPGIFTFKPGPGSDGVSGYVYALNGGATTQVPPGAGAGSDCGGTKIPKPPADAASVCLTPKRERGNLLAVSALDKAGNRSEDRQYRFMVSPVDSRWYWSLDEGEGTTAATQPDNSAPATISGSGVTWSDTGKDSSDGSASFAGTGEFATSYPALKTTLASGFTVAAWVKLPAPDAEELPDEDPDLPDGDENEEPTEPGDDPDGEDSPPDTPDTSPDVSVPEKNQTAVSEDGKTRSMFKLGYRNDLDVDKVAAADGAKAPDPAWCFSVASADTATATETTACTTQYVTPGEWTHLVGVVDPIAGQIRLYVNGTEAYDGAVTTVTGKALWEATAAFAIGRAHTGGAFSERWNGDIDEVYAAPKIWGETDIEDKAHPLDEQ